MKTKRYFSKEFKLKAIELSHKRAGVGIAAAELGISMGLLSRWRSEFYNHKKEAFPGMGNTTQPKDKKLSEVQALKKQLREVTMERDILKKAVGIFSKSDSSNTGLL